MPSAKVPSTNYDNISERIIFLSKDQLMIGFLFQIGTINNIPKDILISIFRFIKQSIKYDNISIRDYHLYRLYKRSLPHITMIQSMEYNLNDIIKRIIPVYRGPEWALKWYGVYTNDKICNNWKYLMKQIQIFGEKKYLYETYDVNLPLDGDGTFWPATFNTKINYLNINSKFDIEDGES